MEQKSNKFLETEPIGKLMRKYAIPCIISLLVAALYNIVDQIFIANASYLGSYGNAANTVAFPLTVVDVYKRQAQSVHPLSPGISFPDPPKKRSLKSILNRSRPAPHPSSFSPAPG